MKIIRRTATRLQITTTLLGLVFGIAALSVQAAQWSASQAALRGYFEHDKYRRVAIWTHKETRFVELEADTGFLGTRPATPDQNAETALWDSLFLFQYYFDHDLDSETFVAKYSGVARQVQQQNADLECNGHPDTRSIAACIIRALASRHSLEFFVTRTDEGYRCVTQMSVEDFKSPVGKGHCIAVERNGEPIRFKQR